MDSLQRKSDTSLAVAARGGGKQKTITNLGAMQKGCRRETRNDPRRKALGPENPVAYK
jgi:hypothetical protein